jgi:carboxyl-terminal processing protease
MVKNNLLGTFRYLLLFLSTITFLITSCKKEEDDLPIDSNTKVNNWILDVMQEVYFWSDRLPKKTDKSMAPEAYFNSLKVGEDRFSVLVPNFLELLQSLQGVNKEAGYEYSLSLDYENESNVIAVILYVKPNSPALEAGLKRGDIIFKINNTQITTSNYRTLISELSKQHTIDFRTYDEETKTYKIVSQKSLNVQEIKENPSYLSKVITLNNGVKVGYYVYNFFPVLPQGDVSYLNEMDEIISGFKNSGVTEIVLDLRYNSGGEAAPTINLGSLLGKGVNSSKIFYENKYNKLVEDFFSSSPNYENRLRRRFLNKEENIGNNLSSNRIFVLTGRNTASASELLINGLKPYMNIILIGHKTVGKNEGSWLIDDKENPENHYGLMPIVFRYYNSLGQSEFRDGFIPDYEVRDIQLPLRELGSEDEPLLGKALDIISGSTARYGEKDELIPLKSFKNSIEDKARSNRFILRESF